MRTIAVSKEDAETTYRRLPDGGAILEGTDPETAERVTFVLTPDRVAPVLDAVVANGDAFVNILEEQVIALAAPGEWDSPGTSEE